jgi:hypothetical protein
MFNNPFHSPYASQPSYTQRQIGISTIHSRNPPMLPPMSMQMYPQQGFNYGYGMNTGLPGGLSPNPAYSSDPLQMQNYFNRIAGIDQMLDPNEFRILYSQLHPEIAMNPYIQQMSDNAFMAADVNGDGRINFMEFMNAYNRLR